MRHSSRLHPPPTLFRNAVHKHSPRNLSHRQSLRNHIADRIGDESATPIGIRPPCLPAPPSRKPSFHFAVGNPAEQSPSQPRPANRRVVTRPNKAEIGRLITIPLMERTRLTITNLSHRVHEHPSASSTASPHPLPSAPAPG